MSIETTPFERGNATIYVLIVVALFAALAMTVSRQSDTSESGGLDDQRADIVVQQLMSYPYQVKQAVEMMTMSGTEASTLDFTQPGQTNFDTPPDSKKIFHPGGGGLVMAQLPSEAVKQVTTVPPPGWYLGMFNNIEWTQSAEKDLVLAAYQLTEQICAKLNKRLTGSTTIPIASDPAPAILIDNDNPPGVMVHPTNNADFEVSACADCEDKPSLCVRDTSGSQTYSFYTIILNR